GARADAVAPSAARAGGRAGEPQDRPPQRRLPAARLAYEPQHLPSAEIERHVVDGAHVTGLAAEEPLREPPSDRVVRLEVADGDENIIGSLRLHRPLRSPPARAEWWPRPVPRSAGRATRPTRGGRRRDAARPDPSQGTRASRSGSGGRNGIRPEGR